MYLHKFNVFIWDIKLNVYTHHIVYDSGVQSNRYVIIFLKNGTRKVKIISITHGVISYLMDWENLKFFFLFYIKWDIALIVFTLVWDVDFHHIFTIEFWIFYFFFCVLNKLGNNYFKFIIMYQVTLKKLL